MVVELSATAARNASVRGRIKAIDLVMCWIWFLVVALSNVNATSSRGFERLALALLCPL
jgi:hypothetical protein